MTSAPPNEIDDSRALVKLETSARAEVLLPADAHVIGEPVTVTQIRYSGLSRVGLLAMCRRGALTYELSLADVVFPTWECRRVYCCAVPVVAWPCAVRVLER